MIVTKYTIENDLSKNRKKKKKHTNSVDVDAFAPPAVTLTFDLQNLIKSSVGSNKYSL